MFSFIYFPISPIRSVKVSSCFRSFIKEVRNVNDGIKSHKYVHDSFGRKKKNCLWALSFPRTPCLTLLYWSLIAGF